MNEKKDSGKSEGTRLNLEKIGWISLYIGILTIPFIPPYALLFLIFGGIVATIYHSRHK